MQYFSRVHLWCLLLATAFMSLTCGQLLANPKPAPQPIPERNYCGFTGSQDAPFDVDAMKRAIVDMAATWPEKFKDSETLLEKVEKFRTNNKTGNVNPDAQKLRREIMLRLPLLDFDKLMTVQRSTGKKGGLGLPANWQSNSSLPKNVPSKIMVLSIKSPKTGSRVIYDAGGSFAGDVDLHFDADRLLFSCNKNGWQVCEINIDGSNFRQVTQIKEAQGAHYDACYLPDGRILFSSTLSRIAVPCVKGVSLVTSLYRMNADGSDMHQVTFDQEHGWSPRMISDGRVVFTRWEYADLPHSNSRILMAMNPDGTNQRSLYGSNSFWPNSLFYVRQIPGDTSKFVGIASGHHGVRRMGELILLDVNKGTHETDGVVQRIPGFGQKVEPVVADRLVDKTWPNFLHPYPLSDKYFLVSGQLSSKHAWNIYLVDVFDNITLLMHQPGFAFLEPVPVQKTPKPPVIPDKVIPGRKDATIVISNIYEGPGLKDIPRGTVKSLRLFTYTFGYPGTGGLYGIIGIDGPWDMRRIMGTVPVEEDGSVMFKVPANTPISIQPLDKEGKSLQLMRSWLTARPGEILSCVGCHEEPGTVPSGNFTIAMKKTPADIKHWYGNVRNYEFEREVQKPVLDRYCVSCHDGAKREDGLVLPDFRPGIRIAKWSRSHPGSDSKHGGRFTMSYFNLFRYVRTPGIESTMALLSPMEFHPDGSDLIMILKKGHHGVQLDDEAGSRLNTWIDLNAPYHGRWSTIVGDLAVKLEADRAATRKLYAEVNENHEVLEVPEYPEIKPVEPRKVQLVVGDEKCDNWPFNAKKAAKLQSANKTMKLNLGKNMSMELVYIPAGKFIMGSLTGHRDETPMTLTEIKHGFWMGKYEVKNRELQALIPEHHSRAEDRRGYQFGVVPYDVNQPDVPAVRVSWKQAMEFCSRLSKITRKNVTLPTEAQWEWACRAGTSSPMNYGAVDTNFSKLGNMADIMLSAFNRNPYAPGRGGVTNWQNLYDNWIPSNNAVNDAGFLSEPVGKYKPNAWGLHDMHGNVAEWTRTLYRPYPYREDDGRSDPEASGQRVVRGGSWRDLPKTSTSSYRRMYFDYHKVFNVGFRIIVSDQ